MTLTSEQRETIARAAEQSFPFITRTGIRVQDLDRGYCRLSMPLGPNVNHVGTMYAGALFTLAELPGGILYLTSFDTARFYPIVKDMRIRFRRPATGEVFVEARVTDEELARIQQQAETEGKSEFTWTMTLTDESGEVIAVSENIYQLRRIGA